MSHPDRQQNIEDRLDHLRMQYTEGRAPTDEEVPLTLAQYQRHVKQILREESQLTDKELD